MSTSARVTPEFVAHFLWEFRDKMQVHEALYCGECMNWYVPKDDDELCINAHCKLFRKKIKRVTMKYSEAQARLQKKMGKRITEEERNRSLPYWMRTDWEGDWSKN